MWDDGELLVDRLPLVSMVLSVYEHVFRFSITLIEKRISKFHYCPDAFSTLVNRIVLIA